MIGIDVIPDTNQPSSLGELCASADSGDLFAVDVFINNVDALTKWEARVEYDSDVLSLEEVDYNHFLVGSGGSVFPSLFELESDGRHFMAAAEFQTAPDSGSGTLARLTMRAVDEGRTTIRVVNTPGYLGPQLSGLVECRWVTPPGTIWDGEYLAGDVVVDGECDGDSPVVTEARSRFGASTDPRREAECSGGSSGGNGGLSSSSTSSEQVVLVSEEGEFLPGGGEDDESSEDGDTDGDSGDSSADDGSSGGGVAGEGSSGGEGDGSESGEEERLGTGTSPTASGGEDTGWIIAGFGAALALVIAGAGLYAFARRRL